MIHRTKLSARAMLAAAMCAASLASVAMPARAAGETCDRAAQLTDAPPASLPMYPLLEAGNGTLAPAATIWWVGVFYDVVLVPQGQSTIVVYDYAGGCLKPVQQCAAASAGPSTPARCTLNANSSRHYVLVRNTSPEEISYGLFTAYHCLRYTPGEGCTP
jgi:hypothetical protein